MKNHQSIALLEARLNRLERNKKGNHSICRKIRREIDLLKKEALPQESTKTSDT